mmetsp:Transcript_15567/g.36400  ORF Transcript_15567/g.36400 Transcript_15567/m.36400 type:complete len:419 (-) Transcript_15567:112-1368(-)
MYGHPATLAGLIPANTGKGVNAVANRMFELPGMMGPPLTPKMPGALPGGEEDLPPAIAEQLKQLREDLDKMTAAAQEAKKNGDEEGSKFKTLLASEIQDKIQELEEKYRKPGPAACDLAMPFMQGNGLKEPPAGMPPAMMPPLGSAMVPPVQPGLLPPPGLPGLPPLVPGSSQDWQRMMTLYQNPELAVNFTQQQALEYEQEKANSTKLEAEVLELQHHFNLTDRHARLLDEQLKKRNNTFEDDVAAMYEILKGAKNPADLLMVSVRWMAEGVFRGTRTPNPEVEKVAKKYKLDAPSACKLAEVLEGRSDPDGDLRKVCTHLERSNRPSALVMMMLKDLKSGNPVEESTKTPAIGSYLHIQENKRAAERRRSRSRGRGRSRSRPRGGRSRSRERDRRRSRSGSARRARSGSRGRRGRS